VATAPGSPLDPAVPSPDVPRDRIGERLLRCLAGLVLCGLGIVAIIHARLGVAPWDVLHQGISDRIGLPIGTVILLVGAVVLAAWWPLGIRPGLGTVLNATLVGLFVNGFDAVYPSVHGPGLQIASLAGGILAIGVGTGLYIGSGLGAGPRDGLMTGIARRGHSLRTTRTVLEVGVLALGWALGGSVGIGTAAFAVAIGPIVHVTLPRLTVGTAPAAPVVEPAVVG
jgi:uncharacterized membrane protein YczE